MALLQPAAGKALGAVAQVGLPGDKDGRGQRQQTDQRQAVVADFQQAIADVAHEHRAGGAGRSKYLQC